MDPVKFPNATTLQDDAQLGRLKITTAFGDTDGDGDLDQIFGYGARSFSIWSTSGELVYDSENFIAKKSLEIGSYTDKRSDDKGAEPEGVTTFTSNGKTYAAVGMERTGDVMIFDLSNPTSPVFVQVLANTSPEGLMIIPAEKSPTERTILVVSNEYPDDATLNIYSK
ncbi:hypothetical protein FUAX_49320 (plasmid) [Fulvitalea axinellae]|uniref:Choice-of-anchor I domain-containing protein n=1 Tax=Fulvitalea axinellae TaxID=1182444 RepID=A0AAU9CTG1_9BACT|nr:hypothetical protein FUAX_49320 [Fulvitalea axinellae]